MTDKYNKGDILKGSKNRRDQAYHPIIYLGEKDDTYFIGGMITHSPEYGNIELSDNHFEKKIDNNPKPSFFVNNYLVKKLEWGPFVNVGRLSAEGIKYVEKELSSTEPKIWENYLPKLNANQEK